MNLFCESGDTDRAIEELERALPIEAMKSVLEHRTKAHGKTAELRRIFEKNGMTCGDLEFVLKVPDMRRLRTAFCRVADGTWRILG